MNNYKYPSNGSDDKIAKKIGAWVTIQRAKYNGSSKAKLS